MRIASGNRMCSVAAYKCSMSLSCRSLYCSLHMNSFVDGFVLQYIWEKIPCASMQKIQIIFCVTEKLESNCSGKKLLC